MLTFSLKKEWYEKIKSGEKTVEYREVKDCWTKQLYNEFSKMFEERFLCKIPASISYFSKLCVGTVLYEEDTGIYCKIRLGYTQQYMTGKISKIEILDGKDTDLHIDAPVYAIHLADVKEQEE